MATRRQLITGIVIGLLIATSLAGISPGLAQTKEVKVGLIAPISGPWARQGELMTKGAQLAIDDINKQGGIKALSGAKMKLVVFDTGDTVEKAKNAAQRMISGEPDLAGATGCFLSSFSLAVSEVTERAELPFLTFSYSDQLTARGFKYIFKTSPTGGQLAASALPTILKLAEQATGKKPATVGILMDNTAAPVSFTKKMREGDIERLGLQLTTDQTFTPPLSDATPLVQQLRSRRPDVLLMLATSAPDDKLILEKLTEFGLGGGKIPVVANGTHIGVPELAKMTNPAVLEGVMSIVSNWGAKGQETIIEEFRERTGQPWMTEDSLSSYGDMWIFKEAIEEAGSADRKKVAEAIRKMDLTTGPALYYPGRRVKFDETGLRVGADLLIYQWQNGIPVTVYPPDSAVTSLKWPRS
jgi:branched-chain amino acid transport system substrate-binding protein